ncbi:unnamed protein product [Knipowitschia caucasica]
MAVAVPWSYQTWSKFKKQSEEDKRRRLKWMQRVMRRDGVNAKDAFQQETEEEEDDALSDGEIEDKRFEQDGQFLERCDFEDCVRAKCDEAAANWQKLEDDKVVDCVSDFQEKGQDVVEYTEMNMDGMLGKEQLEAQDPMPRVYRENQGTSGSHEEYFEKDNSSKSHHLRENSKREKGESDPAVESLSDEESQGNGLEKGKKQDFNQYANKLKLEKTDFETPGPMQRVYRENGSTNFLKKKISELDSLGLSDDPKLNLTKNDYADQVNDSLEEFRLDSAVGGAADLVNQNMEDWLFYVQVEESDASDKDGAITFGKSESKQCEQDSEYSYLTCGMLKNGDVLHNDFYNRDLEPSNKQRDVLEKDSSCRHSASGISGNGKTVYEESYCQDLKRGKEENTNASEGFREHRTEEKNVVKPKNQQLEEEEDTSIDKDDDILSSEVDCYELNEVKSCTQDNHATEIFHTLREFQNAHILTDLELKTTDGKSIHVHAIVLSAVSSLVVKCLRKRHSWFWDKKVELIELGKEVEYKALVAVVEFAYTGAIQCLSPDNSGEIKTTAQYLSAPRIIEICNRELSKSKEGDNRQFVTELKLHLQKIRELWTNEMGFDVTLDVLSASFKVHKVILAACSDYFRAMFTLDMREASQSSIYLQFLSAPQLEALLHCSYTGSVSLSWNCIFEFTITALKLQYQPSLDLCLGFLQREINPNSCLDVASFAEAFGIVKLLDYAEDYMLRQFQQVSRTPKFKDLPARKLLKYLNSFSLCVTSELVVFRAVVKWIQAKPKRRLKLAKELMKTIHFPLMTFKEFKEVQALNMWSNYSLKELYDAIFKDFCSNEVEMQSQCRIYLPKESLVLSGGDRISEDLGTRSISKDLWFGNSLRNHTGIKKATEWRQLCEMPQTARYSHEVAVLHGKLYILGGKKYYGTADTINSLFRYDPLEDSWEELCSMSQARCSFSLVVLEFKLFAIGGQCHPDYLETVEQYCAAVNSWSFSCPLDLPLGGHAARVLAGQIFISGGLNNDYDCLSSVLVYHPEKGSTYLESMIHPRALHCMEVLGEYLYVAGGLSKTNCAGMVDMLGCEMYNPKGDSWTSFSPLPVPHVGAGCAVLEGKFYVLGGYSQEDYSDTKMVHRYDPSMQQWENMGKMPGPNNDLRACVLCLPEHLRLCLD